ncbi:MAG: cell division protein FtsA [Chloroflexi bacterium]|nr:cell division protein FtsA [Dehalococcoidia bacterium]MCO5200812.1 cell division protein FtsA [Chloroflexota bacterium]NJD65884.1 cell division protein FtsA [Chloroflexota bacterium]PWB44935.1 MAG: cell division protein FtsA [Dehalococcoidia bacterium]
MRRRSTVAAIDVGSTKVAVIVGDVTEHGDTRILGVGVAPAAGLSRGVIDNIQSARDAISIAVEKAEQACGMRILSAVVGISGGHISSQNNRGIIAIPDRTRPISADDRSRVLESAGQVAIPTNRQVIHVVPRGYWVEGTDQVSDPVGMFGGRLDAEVHIVSGAVSAIQNLTKCVEGAGVQVDDIVLECIASATSVLAEQEKQQGVALVDLGGSTTSIAVYDEGSVAHTACLPIAGSHLTHDLARVLRCPWESAEQVKCTVGAAFADPAMVSETVEIQAFGTQSTKHVPLGHICEILQARTEEILEMVALELKRVGYLDRLAAGLVLTGGTAQLRGLPEVAELRLGIPARLGRPHGYSGLTDLIGTPAFATSIGLVEYALGGRERVVESTGAAFEVPVGGIFRRLASLGRALMPQ